MAAVAGIVGIGAAGEEWEQMPLLGSKKQTARPEMAPAVW